MRIGICEWSAKTGGEDLFKRLQRVGLSGVQVSYETEGFSEKMERYLAWSAEYEITLTSVGANNFCGRALFDHSEDELVRVITDISRSAAKTEGKLFHIPAFGASHIHNDEELQATAKALQIACDTAAEYGVTVGAENALSLAENEWLMKAVDRPNLKLYFDTQNPETSPHHDATEQAAAFVVIIPEVHVKDCDETGRSVPLGTGTTRFADTLKALVEGGYDGWLLLENGYGDDNPEDEMKDDAARLNALLCGETA